MARFDGRNSPSCALRYGPRGVGVLLRRSLMWDRATSSARHVMAAQRLHADDTTVPILAKGKTDTGRIWTYVRDDRPFGGADPPAALYFASRDRRQEHPAHLAAWSGILQADAYGGYNGLYDPARPGGQVTSALCWSHARRDFFELADIAASARRGPSAAPVSPIALEAVTRIEALFDIERTINGLSPEDRQRVRQEQSRPLVDDLHAWLQSTRPTLSRSSSVAKAPRAKTCDAILGILKEGEAVMDDYEDSPALDAGLVASAQAVEHYEIARYGTLKALAQQLGHKDAVMLLVQTLAEETKTDQLLSKLGGKVNSTATGKPAKAA